MLALVAYADSVDNFLFKVNEKILNPAIEFAFVIALVVFLFGVLEFIRGANSDEKRTKGKDHMLWGLVGFLIMFGVYGILNILVNTFGITGLKLNQKQQTFTPPCIQDINTQDGKSAGSLVPCSK